MYDLEERVLKFSKQLLWCIKNTRVEYMNRNIIDQVVRSWTSIGANYNEANGANGKKDFANKIHICKKEAKETVYRLELLWEVSKNTPWEIKQLLEEAKEIMCIFNKIAQKVKTY
jgi:four helix bundle protein